MLATLSIRDIVLIDRLDVELGPGLTVLTGETGAGKSILLDALGLALGARGDSALVRVGAEQGSVTASFDLSGNHPVFALLAEQGIDAAGELVLRRVQHTDGRTRAFINDQPASVAMLREVGSRLVELHGQHDERALLDRDAHRRLLDAFAGLEGDAQAVAESWRTYRKAEAALADARAAVEQAGRERAFLAHAVEELSALAPQPDEEETLAQRRQAMMQAEKFAGELQEVANALAGDGTTEARLSAALRRLERAQDAPPDVVGAVCAALDRLLSEYAEARAQAETALRAIEFDPLDLERVEERLFALRAAARKHGVAVSELPALAERMAAELRLIEEGAERLAILEKECATARTAYLERAGALSAARREAAARLASAVMDELPPLRLERARFVVDVSAVEPDEAGPHGLDRVEFLFAANPGTPPAPLIKVASGGELTRSILALKVVLAARGSAPTLIFDEIDSAVGGAVAEAIGVRLGRLSETLQVLAVTHSPQVAARASGHILITKAHLREEERMTTRVERLDAHSRREEIARMLSGQEITEEARAAADRLIGSLP